MATISLACVEFACDAHVLPLKLGSWTAATQPVRVSPGASGKPDQGRSAAPPGYIDHLVSEAAAPAAFCGENYLDRVVSCVPIATARGLTCLRRFVGTV